MAVWFQGGSHWFKETRRAWSTTSRSPESMTQLPHRTRLTCTWWIPLQQWSENFSCGAMKPEWLAIWWPKSTIWKVRTGRFQFVKITCAFLTFAFTIVSLENLKFTSCAPYPLVLPTVCTASFVWPGCCIQFAPGNFFFWQQISMITFWRPCRTALNLRRTPWSWSLCSLAGGLTWTGKRRPILELCARRLVYNLICQALVKSFCEFAIQNSVFRIYLQCLMPPYRGWTGKARRAYFARQTGLCRFLFTRKIGPDDLEATVWTCLWAECKTARWAHSWTACNGSTFNSLWPSSRLCKDDGAMVCFHRCGLRARAAYWRFGCCHHWWQWQMRWMVWASAWWVTVQKLWSTGQTDYNLWTGACSSGSSTGLLGGQNERWLAGMLRWQWWSAIFSDTWLLPEQTCFRSYEIPFEPWNYQQLVHLVCKGAYGGKLGWLPIQECSTWVADGGHQRIYSWLFVVWALGSIFAGGLAERVGEARQQRPPCKRTACQLPELFVVANMQARPRCFQNGSPWECSFPII